MLWLWAQLWARKLGVIVWLNHYTCECFYICCQSWFGSQQATKKRIRSLEIKEIWKSPVLSLQSGEEVFSTHQLFCSGCHTLGYGHWSVGVSVSPQKRLKIFQWIAAFFFFFFPKNWGAGANCKIIQMKEKRDIKYWNKKLVWNADICSDWRVFCSWFGPETVYSILKIQWASLSLSCWVLWNIGHKWNKCKCSFRQLQINSWIGCLSSCFDKKSHSQILPISAIKGFLCMP